MDTSISGFIRTREIMFRSALTFWSLIVVLLVPAADAANSSARPAASGASAIPEMQAGKWKLRFTSRGATEDNEMCGDPIDGFSKEVQAYAATTKWGCTMTTNPTGPRSVKVVYDCPSDRSRRAARFRRGGRKCRSFPRRRRRSGSK